MAKGLFLKLSMQRSTEMMMIGETMEEETPAEFRLIYDLIYWHYIRTQSELSLTTTVSKTFLCTGTKRFEHHRSMIYEQCPSFSLEKYLFLFY